ncbi:MAG: MerC domain-containing protein [Bacteroidota bacterium]
MSASIKLPFGRVFSTNISNQMGSIVSGLCLIHCLATPFLFAAHLGIEEHHHASPVWWKSLDIIFLILAFWAVYWSARNSSKSWVKYAMYASWFFLSLVLLNERLELFHWREELIYLPTVSLIGLHIYNLRYCQCEDEECCV